MDKDYLVTKSNYFIMNSSYDLSLEEQKLILTLASMVQPEDEEFKPYKFKIGEFIELLGVENQAKYTETPKITKELMKKVFEIEEGDTLIQTAWLSSAVYKKGTGYVELAFSPYLKPYMLKLNTMFTQYKLANILSMKSKYSPRIYEILKCNEFKKQGYIEIEIVELRKLLKAENIYPKYNDFKRYIIQRTQKELVKISDIRFDFEEIKTGRKVTSLKFYIHSNTKKCTVKAISAKNEIAATRCIEEDPTEIETVKAIIRENIGTDGAEKILAAANGDIDIIKEKYNIAKTSGGIDNIVGWMINAIKNDYKLPIEKRKLDPFIDREQKQYDIDSIEKNLLNY
jgi:plasmid replication initiation protein